MLLKKWKVMLALAVALAACEAEKVDATMGARCVERSDCADRCLAPSAVYPGGMCTLSCASDDECPSDAACLVPMGGICLYTCRDDGDCSFLGSVGGVTWTCQEPEPAKKVCLGPGE